MTAYSDKDRGRSTRIEGGSTKNFLEVPKTAQSGSSYSTLLFRVHEVSEQTGPNFRTSPISAELSVYWDSLGQTKLNFKTSQDCRGPKRDDGPL